MIAQRALMADKWNIGIVAAPIASFLNGLPPVAVEWLPELPDRRHYLADPFGMFHSRALTILAECYDIASGRGELCGLVRRPDGTWQRHDAVLPLSTHAAYPYLFTEESQHYCVPDASHAGDVDLYRAVAFPTHWEKVATLIPAFPAVDPTVFRYGELWWLLCGHQDDEPNARLYAWYASSLAGPWRPHRDNPVKVDARSSRSAGTPFVHEGNLYRPAQDCSETYGGAVALNQLHTLDINRFDEETVGVVLPDPAGPYPHGLHTLSAAGEFTLIDGKRRVVTVAKLRRKLADLTKRQPRAQSEVAG